MVASRHRTLLLTALEKQIDLRGAGPAQGWPLDALRKALRGNLGPETTQLSINGLQAAVTTTSETLAFKPIIVGILESLSFELEVNRLCKACTDVDTVALGRELQKALSGVLIPRSDRCGRCSRWCGRWGGGCRWCSRCTRGRGRGWLKRHLRGLMERIIDVWPRGKTAFASPMAAQCWLEWRQAGVLLPAAAALAPNRTAR